MIRLTRTAALLILGSLVLALGFLLGHWTSGETQPVDSAVDMSLPPCREDPLAHVLQPTRFEVIVDCAAVSGTVEKIEFQLHDGDYRIFVAPDPQYQDLLVDTNEGRLVVEVIAVDQPSVFLPSVGQHATFYGTLVIDRAQDRRVGMHPAWLIATLDVSVSVPSDVAVGDQLTISIDVSSARDGVSRPVSEANLFLEFVGEDGEAVRWEPARTNTLGEAKITFASLDSAGNYTVLVHAAKDRESGIAEAAFKIRRR